MSAGKTTYLGDGVYIERDGPPDTLKLYTSNGVGVTNRIYLEPEVVQTLFAYLKGALREQ